MKKIIVKMRVDNRKRLEKKLEEMELKFGPVRYLHDRVYVPRSYKPNANFVRMVMRTEIREVGKAPKYYVICKRHISDSGVDISYRTEVRDYAEMVQMVHQLGFEKQAEITRQREAIKLAEGEWLYLDKVEKMHGFYVKIERKLGDEEWSSEVREEVLKTLEIIGEKSEVKETYAELQERE